jgi:hypothetical protein
MILSHYFKNIIIYPKQFSLNKSEGQAKACLSGWPLAANPLCLVHLSFFQLFYPRQRRLSDFFYRIMTISFAAAKGTANFGFILPSLGGCYGRKMAWRIE